MEQERTVCAYSVSLCSTVPGIHLYRKSLLVCCTIKKKLVTKAEYRYSKEEKYRYQHQKDLPLPSFIFLTSLSYKTKVISPPPSRGMVNMEPLVNSQPLLASLLTPTHPHPLGNHQRAGMGTLE
jgi:hypothetical protein